MAKVGGLGSQNQKYFPVTVFHDVKDAFPLSVLFLVLSSLIPSPLNRKKLMFSLLLTLFAILDSCDLTFEIFLF